MIDRPAGNRRIYHVDPDGVGALRAYLDESVAGEGGWPGCLRRFAERLAA